MDNQTFLSKLRDAIPFLREVPDDIYFSLEQKLRAKGINVSFSAYHRPVVLIKPSESALYDYYQKKGIRT